MDEFDFEELIADMFNISDEERENESFIENKLYEEFGIEFENAYKFTRKLLAHTPQVKAGLSGKTYHAFVSKKHPVMLMKIEAKSE